MSDERFVLNITYGTVECDSRIRFEGDRGIGEGRKRTVSREGVCGPWSDWEPTGAVLHLNGNARPEQRPEQRNPWWRFWL